MLPADLAPQPDDELARLSGLASRLVRVPYAVVLPLDDGPGPGRPPAGRALREHWAPGDHWAPGGGAPLVVHDAAGDPRFAGLPGVARHRVRGAVALPLLGPDGRLLGAFVVADPDPRRWTPDELELLSVLAGAAAAQLALSRSTRREQAQQLQLAVLADASALLLADLDPDAVLRRLAELAVPELAQWCTAWLPAGDGTLRAVASAGPYGRTWTWPPFTLDGPTVSARAHRSGRPQSEDDLAAALAAALPGSPIATAAATAGWGPAYAVPLVARGRALGAWTLIRHRDSPPFGAVERRIAEHLADRAAQALSLAQQHEGQRETARVLQNSLLPRLRDLPGLTVRARYRPAGGTQVGGDWFDLVDLPDGRVAVVIGDVMGRGVPAAAVMGQVRSAARAYARMTPSPAHVLALLDATVAELSTPGADPSLVTCFLGVHDPRDGSLCWASAGHLPPLLRADGPAAPLAGPVGTPLGAGAGGYADTVTPLAAGSLLVLFTDGLVEERTRDLDAGLDLARRLVDAHAPDDLDGLAEQLLAQVASDEDDVALLLVRTAPVEQVRAQSTPCSISRRAASVTEPDSDG